MNKSNKKRKQHTPAFKAKVGLEATMGIKTVGQIARDYEVHPVQVTQWKGTIRERLPELFEASPRAAEDQQELISQLHEKIAELTVQTDWLKKKCKTVGSVRIRQELVEPCPQGISRHLFEVYRNCSMRVRAKACS